MDRNKIGITAIDSIIDVALRKESVDRNGHYEYITAAEPVALRKESVDRNREPTATGNDKDNVALRKESVDRNAEAINPS